MLQVNNIEVIYDHVILVLKGVSLDVPKGRIVAILGANGAGKTTTLKAISNLLQAERGEVTKGSIDFDGTQVHDLSPNELVKRGCIQVMEGRHVFEHLTVEENLLTVGLYTKGRQSCNSRGSGKNLQLLSSLKREKIQSSRIHFWRGTANAGNRPGTDVKTKNDLA